MLPKAQSKLPTANSKPSSPQKMMHKLKEDDSFVKQCLRNKDLWSKLSDDEKKYCKGMNQLQNKWTLNFYKWYEL